MPFDDVPSVVLLDRYRTLGDEEAVAEVYERYARRLIALARQKLSARFNRRVDPLDVAHSALRSFFVRVRDGRIELRPNEGLWNLLATIVVRKAYGQMEHHLAARRDVGRETDADSQLSVEVRVTEGLAREPAVAEVLAMHDELDLLLAGCKPSHRTIIELRLQDLSTVEIAAAVQLHERTIRLVLADFETKLRTRLAEDVLDNE
jgi:DNA-directed RNA polymerase specialized sigma24 family protein